MDILYCGLTVMLLIGKHCVFGIGLSKSTCDTYMYVPCSVPDNYRVQSIASVTVSGETIHLIKSDTALSWYQSYQMCQSILGNLTIIDDLSIQQGIGNITIGSDESVWVSGTRKKHGKNWTWVNETLDDCEYTGNEDEVNCNEQVQGGREYGYVYNPAGTIRVGTTADSLAQERRGICKYNFTEDSNRWHGNQNECFGKENRLATLEEVQRNHGTIPNNNFYIGLQYRPWIWLVGDMPTCTVSPIIFNNWKGPDRQGARLADCLTVNNKDGTWEEHSCTEQLHYFLCTGDIRIPDPDPSTYTTDASPSTNTQESWWCTACIVGICCGIFVALAIIGIIVYFCYNMFYKKDASTCFKKGATPIKASSGQSNPAGPKNDIDVSNEGVTQVNPYGFADLSKLESRQSEAAAYRPSSAQYAEVGGDSLQIDSKKTSANTVAPSEYSLVRPISEGPTGGPATYGEVKKRDDDDDVILVDNQNYGAYNPAVDGKIPSGVARAQQLPPIGQDKGSKKPAPAQNPPNPPKTQSLRWNRKTFKEMV